MTQEANGINVLQIPQDIYEAAGQIMNSAQHLIQANTFCIASNDRENSSVISAFNRNRLIIPEGTILPYHESYCHLIIEQGGDALVINDNTVHPWTSKMSITETIGKCSVVGVPIKTKRGQIYGTLCAFDPDQYSFKPEDIELMKSLAVFFAYAIELNDTVDTLRIAEETAQRTLDDKAGLLEIMSHEVRTPMNGILNMAQMLSESELTAEQRKYTEVIERSSLTLLTIMNDILDYAKMNAVRMELNKAPWSVHDSLEQIFDLFSAKAKTKNIELSMQIEERVPVMLWADPGKIHQILQNLVSNAIKFTPGGRVHVTVGPHESMESGDGEGYPLYFRIEDTGIGIPAERVGGLFEPFSQAHSFVPKEDQKGTGLGLAICKQLVGIMNGSIWVETEVNRGSTFHFVINVDREYSEA